MRTARSLAAAVLIAVPAWTARAADGPGLPALPDPPAGPDPVIRDPLAPAPPGAVPWDTDQRPGREPLRAGSSSAFLFGSLTAQQTVRDGEIGTVWDDPLAKRGWQSDNSWKMDVLGPLSAFGQLTAAGEETMQQDTRLNGRYGLACKVPVPVGELTFKGGPNVTYTDTLRPERTKEKSEMLLEVQARCPLLFGVALEFQGSAAPARTPLDRDWVSEELRLALPVGTAGKLNLGARQRWENVVEQRSTTDGPQLFLGLELKR